MAEASEPRVGCAAGVWRTFCSRRFYARYRAAAAHLQVGHQLAALSEQQQVLGRRRGALHLHLRRSAPQTLQPRAQSNACDLQRWETFRPCGGHVRDPPGQNRGPKASVRAAGVWHRINQRRPRSAATGGMASTDIFIYRHATDNTSWFLTPFPSSLYIPRRRDDRDGTEGSQARPDEPPVPAGRR